MKSMILILLVIPLCIVFAVRNPEAAGHLVGLIITIGAKLLDGAAVILNSLLSNHPA